MNSLQTLFAVCAVSWGLLAPGSAVELISADSVSGQSAKGASTEPALSSDGRFVVFASLARLTPDDTNTVSDVYLKDRLTGKLERISDERGGDQPILSGTGRKVVFRALDAFPKLRLVDREFDPAPRTISFPFGGGRSFRYSDSAVITPDGRYVAFTFRPIPGFSNSSETQLCLDDTTEPDRNNLGNISITDGNNASFLLHTLGRSAMDAAATFFFIETDEGLAGFDTNGATDIYRIESNGNFLRVSAASDGLPNSVGEEAGKGAHDPALSGDATKLFFISDRQLRAADTDGGPTIYRSTSNDNFNVPEPILPDVRPLALSRQATGNGDYLVFLGQPKRGSVRPYLLNVNSGALTELAASAPEAGGAPAISADNHTIAFVTKAAIATSPATDRNRGEDVAVIENPELAQIPTPFVTLTAPADGTVITTSQTATLGASSTSPGGAVILTAVEVDGFIFNSRNGTSVPTGNFALGVGIHKLRALSFTRDGLVAQTALQTLIVRQASAVGLTGLNSLTQNRRADGSVDFAASVRVDNAIASSRDVRVHFIETTPGAKWELFGNAPDDGDNRILETFTQTLAANGSANAVISSNVGATQVIPDPNGNFQGVGRRVVARLQVNNGGSFVDVGNLFTVLEVFPLLDENTPGPNGGIPVLNGPNVAPFNPVTLQSLQIVGSTSVPELTKATYRANAVFNTETKACTPVWSVVNGGTFATISSSGLLTLGNVPSARTFQVKAAFGGLETLQNVTVQPVSPVVSVVAADKKAAEVAGSGKVNRGAFKLVRTPAQSSALTVHYTISGTATPGADYGTLSGTATFPASVGSVVLPVNVLDDSFFEGNETVIVTLASSEDYRLGKASAATVTISDDEPVPVGLPDAIIKRGQAVGTLIFSNDSSQQQSVIAKGVRNVAATFTVQFDNRSGTDAQYTITGAGDFLGFSVQYLNGKTDVTTDVVAGNFSAAISAGKTANLTVKITPSDDTPLKAVMRCPITAQDRTTGFQDAVEAVIQRIR